MLAIYVILNLTLSLFSSFAHQTARESAEIVHPCGIGRSVVVGLICETKIPTYMQGLEPKVQGGLYVKGGV